MNDKTLLLHGTVTASLFFILPLQTLSVASMQVPAKETFYAFARPPYTSQERLGSVCAWKILKFNANVTTQKRLAIVRCCRADQQREVIRAVRSIERRTEEMMVMVDGQSIGSDCHFISKQEMKNLVSVLCCEIGWFIGDGDDMYVTEKCEKANIQVGSPASRF